jgi:predicted dithiol-disulfide oxidoreductase (DUF899 family)
MTCIVERPPVPRSGEAASSSIRLLSLTRKAAAIESTPSGARAGDGLLRLLDLTPMGRNEEGEQVFWLRRHDEYEAAGSRSAS